MTHEVKGARIGSRGTGVKLTTDDPVTISDCSFECGGPDIESNGSAELTVRGNVLTSTPAKGPAEQPKIKSRVGWSPDFKLPWK